MKTHYPTPSSLEETQAALDDYKRQNALVRGLRRLGVLTGYPDNRERMELYRERMGAYGRLSDDISALIKLTRRARRAGAAGVYPENVQRGEAATFLRSAMADDQAMVVTAKTELDRLSAQFSAASPEDILASEVRSIGFGIMVPGTKSLHEGQHFPEARKLAILAQVTDAVMPTTVWIPFTRETLPHIPCVTEMENTVARVANGVSTIAGNVGIAEKHLLWGYGEFQRADP